MGMEIETTEEGLLARAPAKLNLHLSVSPPRADGYHDIDSIFQAVSLYDEIRFAPAAGDEISLVEDGIAEAERNLVYRAAVLLRDLGRARGKECGGVRISLCKHIPFGSGLGGGSSDAAATLVSLNRIWGIGATRDDLVALGARLGSDVPFFLFGGTARCRGRGELVTPLHDLFDAAEPLHYAILAPAIHAPTPQVYAALDRLRSSGIALTQTSVIDSIARVDLLELSAKGAVFSNDLEMAAYRLFPELEEIASRMRQEPFLSVRMTGSGSALFGLCRSAQEAARLTDRLRAQLGENVRVRVFGVQSLPGLRWTDRDGSARRR